MCLLIIILSRLMSVMSGGVGECMCSSVYNMLILMFIMSEVM